MIYYYCLAYFSYIEYTLHNESYLTHNVMLCFTSFIFSFHIIITMSVRELCTTFSKVDLERSLVLINDSYHYFSSPGVQISIWLQAVVMIVVLWLHGLCPCPTGLFKNAHARTGLLMVNCYWMIQGLRHLPVVLDILGFDRNAGDPNLTEMLPLMRFD